MNRDPCPVIKYNTDWPLQTTPPKALVFSGYRIRYSWNENYSERGSAERVPDV